MLSEIGLPTAHEPLFESTPLVETLRDERWLVRFGTDYGTDMVIEIATGRVMSVPREPGKHPARFVNASLAQFVDFLVAVATLRGEVIGVEEPEALAAVDRVEPMLRRLDPEALNDDENWWSSIVQQIRLGHL